jgi:DNA repair photolyase
MKGRGAASNPPGRFTTLTHERELPEEEAASPRTELRIEQAREVLVDNDSPDLPFERALNPYRGCEHGCVYCYARPSHAYLGLSPGLDFETRISAKINAAERLRAALARPGYRPKPINLGANTDPYQPAERKLALTRRILEVLLEHHHPASIVTKSALVLRDLDLLRAMASKDLIVVGISITTLDNRLAARMEPRATAPHRRLAAIQALAEAGVPVGVFAAPMIPALNDHELEAILTAAAAEGARFAGYTLIRLPHELKALFREWLEAHFPARASHVLSLIREMRGGRENDPRFFTRMRGEGPYAELLAQRFRLVCKRLGLAPRERIRLDTSRFRVPSAQGELF